MQNRRLRPKFSLLLLSLLAPLSGTPVSAETSLTVHPDGRVLFTGDTARASLGYATGGYFHGELAGVLFETDKNSWLGEAWFSRSAGGAKVSYHLLSGDTVHKYFVAHDQNQMRDRKLTLGYGLEKESWFGNLNLSKGLTDRRLIDKRDQVTVFQENGSVDNAPYIDTVTRTTTTRLYEKGYDYGVGIRAGRYYSDNGIRMTTGFDYEWGRSNARQSTLSLVAEKMFVGTPHSVALQIDQRQKSGDVEVVRNETRALVTYRYSFGSMPTTQPERLYRMVPVKQELTTRAVVMPEPTVVPARIEKKWIKTKASMNGDAFFEFDSAKLTPLARTELDRIATLLKSNGREGDVRIVGHTCDIGPDKANDRLSVKRAEAVRDYLVAANAFNKDDSVVEGKGKREPKYPATPESREKNRRVELEFFSFLQKEEIIEIPAQVIPGKPVPAPEPPVTYEREYVDQPAAWTKRAMRAAALHKRTVDVYRSKEETQSETRTRVLVNRAPSASDDVFSVAGGSTTALAVLGNDNDPDTGDAITLASTTAPSVGQVRIEGRQLMYTAPANFSGQDQFTYTIKDSKGLPATGNVVVTITASPEVPNRVPVASDDAYTVNSGSTTALTVLSNDSDPDTGDTVSLSSITPPSVGQVRIDGRQLMYTAPVNFAGQDRFTYTIKDSKGLSATGNVVMTIAKANQAPTTQGDKYYISNFKPTPLDVLSNDSDPDGDVLSIVSVTQPLDNVGLVEIAGSQLMFTMTTRFLTSSFTYTISDGKGGTSTATVELIDP